MMTAGPAEARAVRAVTRIQRPTAMPTQSNPAPRFEVEPGTRTVTLGRMGVLRVSLKNRKARAMPAAGGRFLAPCLTWRQYAANHHERFRCYVDTTASVRDRQGGVADGENPRGHPRRDRHRGPAVRPAAR